jgi:Zn-dependent protease with chaperone function
MEPTDMNTYSYWFSDKLVLKRYRAAEVGPQDGGRLYSRVAELTQRAGLQLTIPQEGTRRYREEAF